MKSIEEILLEIKEKAEENLYFETLRDFDNYSENSLAEPEISL